MNKADIVFEQTDDFKFIIRKSRVSNVGNEISANLVEDAFGSYVYRVIIIDSSNNVLSDNKVERKPTKAQSFGQINYEEPELAKRLNRRV